MTPNTTPTASAAARPNSTTRASNAGVTAAGNRPGGISAGAARRIAAPTPMPSIPPSTASTRLSVSSCLMMRPRAAPSADRTAISRVRAAARASSRLATFAQHRSSTKPTTPSRNIDVVAKSLPTMPARTGSTITPVPLFASGYACASRSAMTFSSACAASIVTPGFSRATTSKARAARNVGMSGNWPDSVQISAGRENCTLSATTPTTVYGWPFSRTRRPTIEGSLLNRRRHTASPSSTTRGDGPSSSGLNVRPTIGITLRTSKKLALVL